MISKFLIPIYVNGGEYGSHMIINAEDIILIDIHTIKIDNIVIQFDNDMFEVVKKSEFSRFEELYTIPKGEDYTLVLWDKENSQKQQINDSVVKCSFCNHDVFRCPNCFIINGGPNHGTVNGILPTEVK